MTTALAQQLARLSAPQTQTLNRDKSRASLLFDPKDAAGLSRDTLFKIGLEGLEELQTINAAFFAFSENLFSPQSKDVERAVQTDEVNSTLNKSIKKCLLLLSPYFLRSCAHKALEWLIHRYQINEYNVDDLMWLILPYHESNIFVRALQTIRISDNGKWIWLKPLQRRGVHLPKATLYSNAAGNAQFLTDVGNYVSNLYAVHHNDDNMSVALHYFCAVYTGTIEHLDVISETQITHMLPGIVKGLYTRSPRYLAGCYIIIAKLLQKVKLKTKTLNTLVDHIFNSPIDSLHLEAVLVLVLTYQSQDQYTTMPTKTFIKISETTIVISILRDLVESYHQIDALFNALMEKSIWMLYSKRDPSHFRAAAKMLDAIFVMDLKPYIPQLISLILTSELQETSEEQCTFISGLFKNIDIQYPVIFDETVASLMKKTDSLEGQQRQENLRKLYSVDTLPGIVEIFHPNSDIRSISFEQLMNSYDTLESDQIARLRSVIQIQLSGQDLDILSEIISRRELLLKLLERKEIVTVLVRILYQCFEDKEMHDKLCNLVLQTLCEIANDDDVESLIAVIAYLTSGENVKAVKIIFKSQFGKENSFLKTVRKSQSKLSNKDQSLIFNALKLPNNGLPSVQLIASALGNKEFENSVHQFATSLVLISALDSNCDSTIIKMVIDIIDKFRANTKTAEGSPSISTYMNFTKQGYFPLQGFLLCFEIIIAKATNIRKLQYLDLGRSDDATIYCILKIMDVLTCGIFSKPENVERFSNVLNSFLTMDLTNINDKILLLLNIIMSDHEIATASLMKRCSLMVKSLCKNKLTLLQENTEFMAKMLIYVLIMLKHDCPQIRSDAWEMFEYLRNNYQTMDTDLKEFINKILSVRKEITLDIQKIQPILCTITMEDPKIADVLLRFCNLVFKTSVPKRLKSDFFDITVQIPSLEIYTASIVEATKCFDGKSDTSVLTSDETRLVVSTIHRFTTLIAADVKLTTPSWNFMDRMISNSNNILVVDGALMSPSVLALSVINRATFAVLLPNVKEHLLNTIVTAVATSNNTDVTTAALKVFKHIDLKAGSILKILESMRDAYSARVPSTMRKRRISIAPTQDILDTTDWKKGVTVLEAIQEKKRLYDAFSLLSVLFDLLKRCLEFDEQTLVEYPKQLLLSCIYHCCGRINIEEGNMTKVSDNIFNMSLIVQCMRASWNPQTHHHALSLLTYASTFSADQVLQNIMAIFTFMGSSYLRHDDAYSFQIIHRVIDEIIPILVQDGTVTSIMSVLGVFVDAIMDVPEHRRLTLYHNFLKKIDSTEHLSKFLLLIFCAVVDKQSSTQKEGCANRLDIAASLMNEFDAPIILETMEYLLTYLRALPVETTQKSSDDLIFQIDKHTPKEFRHYKYTIVRFMVQLLTSSDFVNKVAQLPIEDMLPLESVQKNIIVHCLTFIQVTSKMADRSVNTPQAQYWKVLLHHSHEILDSINALLTPQMFLLVIQGLVTHTSCTVRRRALELLNTKLQHHVQFFDICTISEMNAIITPIINIMGTVNRGSPLTSEEEVIVQTALLSFKLLTKLLAHKQPEKFVHLLTYVTELAKKKLNPNIRASLILCIAELCSSLEKHAIPNLTSMIPMLIKIIDNHKGDDLPNLFLSALSALQKIIQSLCLFLSPYLEKLIIAITSLAAKWRDDKNPKLTFKLNFIMDKISNTIEPRILIPIVESTFNQLIAKHKFGNVAMLMRILSKNMDTYKGQTIQNNIVDLTAFYINALQLRCNADNYEAAVKIEMHIIQSFVSLILKLSESTFRPLYHKLYDWAVQCDDGSERPITFYALSAEISKQLKGLFVVFSGYILSNAASILDKCNATKTTLESSYYSDDIKSIVLLENVLGTLNGVFMHDSHRFINKERFDLLMQPLVDQLENQLGGIDKLMERGQTVLVPCIVNFAAAVNDDALWKLLNYQVCLKMRHSEHVIRLLALECLTETVKKIGDNFLPLLPETIPFLAELLEDEVESVEKACQKSVQQMEHILGEPLQKYF